MNPQPTFRFMRPIHPKLLFVILLFWIALAVLFNVNVSAATITRSYSLKAGWNAVYLDVRPADATAETVLAGLPITSVWRHQTRLTSVDFIQDPTEPVWNQDQWLVHVPTNRIESLDNNLFQIQGGFPYLIQLSAPATWNVTGEPLIRNAPWKPDAFNLRGFPIDGATPPTFRDFFKFSPAHYNSNSATLQPIYTLGSDGQWKQVSPTDLMQEGAAYWVFASGPSEFVAPFEARNDSTDALNFGTLLRERNLNLVNLAGSPVTSPSLKWAAQPARHSPWAPAFHPTDFNGIPCLPSMSNRWMPTKPGSFGSPSSDKTWRPQPTTPFSIYATTSAPAS